MLGTRGSGGAPKGHGSRLGQSRGLSEPARPRDRPKISDTFSPKPHTDSAGGDTENIFFLFLPPYPPTSLPARLPPPPPALAPPSPAACPCPAPSSVPWGWGGGDGWGRLGGAVQDAWVSAPPICWAFVAPSPGGRAELAEVSVLGSVMPTLSLWRFPLCCHLGRPSCLWSQNSARPVSGTTQGRQ